MKNKKGYHSFFQNKKCQYCGKPATKLRLIKDRKFLLCDSKICELKTRIWAKYFNAIDIKGKV